MLVIMVAQNSPKLTIVRPRGSTLVAQADIQADLPVDLPLAPKNNPSDTAAVEQQAMGEPSGRSEGRRFGFTKDLLNRLPCPTNGQRAYYFDTKGSRGFGIAVTTTGRKNFILYRKVNGRPERIQIGPFPDLTIEQARRTAAELNGAIARGENPANTKREVRDEMTLRELFAQFGELYGQRRRTWPEMQRLFKKNLRCWHLRKISSIKKLDVIKLHARLGQKKVGLKKGRKRGPYAANRTIELLSSMFNWAATEAGWKGENPAARIKAFKEKKRERFLLPEEAEAFFRALDAEPNEDIRDYLYLSLFTGGRRSNVQAMRWPQINFNRVVWTIPAEEAKEDEPLIIPLLPQALEILKRRKQSATNEWVFPGRGRTGHLVEPKSCWRRILEAAGLSDLWLHDLRRTLGSWQAMTGASLPIIGKSLGHAPGSTATSVYARLIDAPVRESMQKATNALLLAGKVQRKR